MRIPFYSPAAQHASIREKMEAAFHQVLARNWFVLGAELEAFEKEFAAYHRARFCVGVGNGLDALFLSLAALQIGPGDEVIVPAHTYVATWLAVSRTGATPVPIDAGEKTGLMNCDQIEIAITKKTKAILPVHLYGLPCDMARIGEIAQKHDLKIVEDNAQATGASFGNKKTGTFGHCGAFSFYPTKTLGALGDGGAILTDDEEVYETLLIRRNYGQKTKYNASVQGINSRLDELQAALLRIKLPYLDQWNEQRQQLAAAYRKHLHALPHLSMPEPISQSVPVFHIFSVMTSKRDELRQYLFDRGIETMVHYPLLPYQQQAYSEIQLGRSFPVSEKIARQQLSLPIWPGMTLGQVEEISDHVRLFLRR